MIELLNLPSLSSSPIGGIPFDVVGWRRWARGQVQQKPGRTALLAIGTAIVVAAFLQDDARDNFAIAALFVGGLLCAAGGLRITRGRAGPGGLSFETEPEAAAALAEEVTEEAAEGHVDVDEDDVLDATRFFVADQVLKQLLRPQTGILAGTEFHLYVWDTDVERLMPVFEADDAPASEGWAIGQGITGEAYQSRRYVVAYGEDTHGAKYGLTPDQQERYAELEVVAAVPVVNAAGKIIAVLSGSSTDSGSALAKEEGFDAHLVLAISVGRVLIDLLKWFPDD